MVGMIFYTLLYAYTSSHAVGTVVFLHVSHCRYLVVVLVVIHCVVRLVPVQLVS
jgi:hypothetical protein